MSNHICFHSKQSGANTPGSSSLLLKAFWGLLRGRPRRSDLSALRWANEDGVWCIWTWNSNQSSTARDTYGSDNLRGVLQQDEVATLLGWATLKTQVLTFFFFFLIQKHSWSSLMWFAPFNKPESSQLFFFLFCAELFFIFLVLSQKLMYKNL